MPSGLTDGPSDWNGQDYYCNSLHGTISVRGEEHQENQQHIPRAEEVPLLLLQVAEDLRQPPGGWGQELPSGALRDEVEGDNPPHGVGGTRYGIRKCPRGATRPRKSALPLSARREKREMSECENRKQKCESLSQDTNFTPFSDTKFNTSIKPLKKQRMRQTKLKKTYSQC